MAGYQFWYIDPDSNEYTLIDQIRGFLRPNGMHGFGVMPIQPAAEQRPYRQGVIIIGKHYTAPRQMDIVMTVTHDSHADLVTYVRSLARNASPHKDPAMLGALKVLTPDGLYRQIDCWLSEFPDPKWDGPVSCDLTPSFWAPDPFFYDPTEQTQTFGLANPGGLAFPVDTSSGWVFSASDVDVEVSLVNDGDVETWPTIRVNGPGDNPSIVNETTGKTIAITQSLTAGEYVDIDMDAATITKNGTTNVISSMSASSVFWPMARGENLIHVTMANVTTGSIIVNWYNRYQSGL